MVQQARVDRRQRTSMESHGTHGLVLEQGSAGLPVYTDTYPHKTLHWRHLQRPVHPLQQALGTRRWQSTTREKARAQPQPTWGWNIAPSGMKSESNNFPQRYARQSTSPSMIAPQILACGWKTTDSCVAWWGSRTTIWSSNSFPSILRKRRGLGSSTYRPAPYTIEPISEEHSSETSMAATSSLEALSTSRRALKRAERAFRTTSKGSPKKERTPRCHRR
jgi:hypothetical protein